MAATTSSSTSSTIIIIIITVEEQTTTTTSKGLRGKRKKKIQGKTSYCPHTQIDSWSLGRAAQTRHNDDDQRWRGICTKQKISQAAAVQPFSDTMTTAQNKTRPEPETETEKKIKNHSCYFPLCSIYSTGCVCVCVRDVKRTTVLARWWRVVYWSGSLCLCDWFDIHATFASRRWEGKLLFLAPWLLFLCVCVWMFITVTHTHINVHTCTHWSARVVHV